MANSHETELQRAMRLAEERCKQKISPELAQSFITMVGDKKERMPFVEALRYSLNELSISKRDKRDLYACCAGYFFGRRSNLVRERKKLQLRREKNKKGSPQKPSAVGDISFDDKTGQGKFRV